MHLGLPLSRLSVSFSEILSPCLWASQPLGTRPITPTGLSTLPFWLVRMCFIKIWIVKFFRKITLYSDVKNDESTSISSSTSWTSPGTSDRELKIWAELSRVRNSSSYHTNSKYIYLHDMDIKAAFIKIISPVTLAKQ